MLHAKVEQHCSIAPWMCHLFHNENTLKVVKVQMTRLAQPPCLPRLHVGAAAAATGHKSNSAMKSDARVCLQRTLARPLAVAASNCRELKHAPHRGRCRSLLRHSAPTRLPPLMLQLPRAADSALRHAQQRRLPAALLTCSAASVFT